jgi:hypothetical protein
MGRIEGNVIKVLWFLKRADGLSLEEFREWWLGHAQDVMNSQQAHLAGYVVNIREADDDSAPGATSDGCEWDGIAEQWFADRAAFEAAYSNPSSATRADTLAHTSRFSRMIVGETRLR